MNANKTVLIIDESANNIEICKISLEQEGYKAHPAKDIKIGLSLVEKIRPDIILLEIAIGNMDGFLMLECLSKDPVLRDIPVLVLTVMTDTAYIVRALQLGANDYLKKPFDADEFIARVNRLTKLKDAQELKKKKVENLLARHNTLQLEIRNWIREMLAFQKDLEDLLNVPPVPRFQGKAWTG